MSLKTLTFEESDKLVTELLTPRGKEFSNARSIRNYALGIFMLDAGLRVGEVTRLVITDLLVNDMPVKSLEVRKAVAKGHRERIVPLSNRIVEAIRLMHRYIWSAYIDRPLVYAFKVSIPEEPLSTRQVERIIKRAAEAVLGRPVHPHVLRHTFASRLMRKVNARIVQELLGHKHLSSTQVYTHPNHDDLTSAIESLNSQYEPQTSQQT